MIDDDDEGDSGPMPALVDPRLADLHDQLKAAEKAMAQSKAVSKQKDDALEAQMLRMARAVEERRKARDKEKEDSAVASALRAKIERAQSVTVAPETLSSPRSVAMPAPYVVPLPPLHVAEAAPKPSDMESVVAATDNDDDKRQGPLPPRGRRGVAQRGQAHEGQAGQARCNDTDEEVQAGPLRVPGPRDRAPCVRQEAPPLSRRGLC